MPESTLTIFSGGTAFNSVCRELTESLTSRINHILPVSDNGGSSREIVRVLGGPAIGDIRSRLIRLASETTEEQRAIKALLEYRLPNDGRIKAKQEMLSIVDGTHHIWHPAPMRRDRGDSWSHDKTLDTVDTNSSLSSSSSSSITPKPVISEAYKQTVRAFLVHFFDAVLRKSSVLEQAYSPTMHGGIYAGPVEGINEFDFRNGSVGNFVFTGARLFFNSLQAAIFWFSNLSNIPENSRVIPVLNVNTRVTIAGVCKDKTEIIGQDEISHPRDSMGTDGRDDDVGNLVKKYDTTKLSSPIERVYYVNQFGTEIYPPPSNDVIVAIRESNGIVYGMGSLYTSIIPSLILIGVGGAIRNQKYPKILLLNTWEDRETAGLSAIDYVVSITRALLRNDNEGMLQQAGFKYDASKNIGYSFGSDNELDIGGKEFSMRASDSQTTNYLLKCGAHHYVNIIFFIDCVSVRATIMTQVIQSKLEDLGIECVGLKGTQIENNASASKPPLSPRYVFEANELVEALQITLSRSPVEE